MRAGLLRHLCMLQRLDPDAGADSFGQPIKAWLDVEKVWCKIEPASMASMRGASETILAGAETPVDVRVITMRPRTDVNTTNRLVYGPQIFDLKAVRVNNRVDEMTFFATIGASQG